MKKALDIMLDAPEFDMIVAVVGSSARFQPELAVKPIMDSAVHEKPLIAMLVPDAPQALAQLTEAGIPCFRSPEGCADSIASVLARRVPGMPATVSAGVSRDAAHTLSEAQAYALLDTLGVPHAPALTMPMSEKPTALPFDFPVVAKVCSSRIPHKTEVGGVVLGVRNAEELEAAFTTLRTNLAMHAPALEGIKGLVAAMRGGLAVLLVGYRVFPDAGPIIMLAAGGMWAELARDRSIRRALVSVDTVLEMIAEVCALK